MGGCDCYCVVCGMLAGELWLGDDDDNDDTEFSPDRALLNKIGTAWTSDVNILGRNSKLSSLKKAFLTGAAEYDDFGTYRIVEPGDHPELLPDNSEFLHVFGNESGQPNFPVHYTCLYNIFSKVLANRWKFKDNVSDYQAYGLCNNVDIDIFYHTCALIGSQPFGRHLDLDYGAQNEFVDEQYSVCIKGNEDLWGDPSSPIPEVVTYLKNPPMLRKGDTWARTVKAHQTDPSRDIFAKLPVEIIIKIMLCIDQNSVSKWRLASQPVSLVQLSGWYWRLRLSADAPWLLELDYEMLSKWDKQMDLIDWRKIYWDMLHFSDRSSPRLLHRLANRRRIWRTCDLIADLYVQKAKIELEQDNDVEAKSMLELLQASLFPQLVWPQQKPASSNTAVLISGMHDLSGLEGSLEISDIAIDAETKLIQNVSFSFSRRGLHAQKNVCLRPIASIPDSNSKSVLILPGDWIVGVEIIMDSVPIELFLGDRSTKSSGGVVGLTFRTLKGKRISVGQPTGPRIRVLHAPAGHLVLGFQTEWFQGGILRFAILHAQTAEAQLNQNPPRKDLMECTWARGLPPDNVRRSSYDTGYWHFDFSADTAAFEFLIWSKADDSSSTLAKIGIDAYLRGFSSISSDGSTQSFGRCAAMKFLELDIEHGEKIISMWTSTTYMPTCVCFVTNFGRQIHAGDALLAGESQWRRHIIPEGYAICGLYATLGDYGAVAVAPLFLPHETHGADDGNKISDSDNRLLEPSLWPEQWEEEGPILGYDPNRASTRPPSLTQYREKELLAASWFALTKPVEHIKAIQCHTTPDFPMLAVVGLVITYSDGTRATVGVECLGEMDTRKDAPWYDPETSDCGCGFKAREYPDATGPIKGAHFAESQWKISNDKISEIRVWGETSIDGIEFITLQGQTVQLGNCKGEPKDVMARPEGLKVFMARSIDNTTYYRDDVIAGLQALRLRE